MKQLMIALCLAFMLIQADQSPMGWQSNNPTLAEVYDEIRALSLTRPDLSEDDLVGLAIKRAYEKKQGKRI